MLKFNKDQKRLPIGGHHYAEYGKTFKGKDVPDLSKQVAAFRLSNNIPAGNPEQEILTFYAQNWPYMVKEDREAVPVMEDVDYKAWRDWIYNAWSHPPKKLLTGKEAKERWEACLKCPARKTFPWKSTDESSELVRRAYVLRRGQETGVNNSFCDCYRADLSLFVFLDGASVQKDPEAPKNCWTNVL